MDPFIFWAFIVLLVLALIIFGMVSAKLRQRKLRRLRREAMPVVSHAIRAGIVYNVFLSNGTISRR